MCLWKEYPDRCYKNIKSNNILLLQQLLFVHKCNLSYMYITYINIKVGIILRFVENVWSQALIVISGENKYPLNFDVLI